MAGSKTYFLSDVHLGLQAFNPQKREERFVDFLRSINTPDTKAIYLLGDIWDFWYEWKEVVPKGYVKVLAAIVSLIESGVEVYFIPGNHDIWAYGYFEELGMKKLQQPQIIKLGGKTLCVGHGDGLGDVGIGYRMLNCFFKNNFAQKLFSSLLHPTLAMRLGQNWSKGNRLARGEKYIWKGKEEPLVKWCEKLLKRQKVDLFIFGHYHLCVQESLSCGSELIVLDSWMDKDSVYCIEEEAQS